MKIEIIILQKFKKELEKLILNKKLLETDYKDLKDEIAQFPEKGNIIPGTNGLRKIRLKSPTGGKSGGFRICYYYIKNKKIFLMLIYSKNTQENLIDEE